MVKQLGQTGGDWSREELEAIVADYLRMLTLELSGQSYNKSAHRRSLQALLPARSEASIEFKHGNISAVMLELGYPYIKGYQPRSNYQGLLIEVVVAQYGAIELLDAAARLAVETPALVPEGIDFRKVKADAPALQHRAEQATDHMFERKAFKRDHLAREASNASLGLAGEQFVVQFEHWRLVELGANKLADRVEHVSRTKGDGLGFDVLSFDVDGRERLIEVKTTTFGRDTPFFVTNNELSLSRQQEAQFHLYRLFDFRKSPRLFDLTGRLDRHCVLDPGTYRATFN